MYVNSTFGSDDMVVDAPQQSRSPLWEKDQEQQRWNALLRDDGPTPRPLQPAEREEIGRFLGGSPSLRQFRRDGIERFLGNAGVLPDGRALFVYSGHPRLPVAVSFVSWGGYFGPCLRCMVLSLRTGGQIALLPGDAAFEALKDKKVVLAFIRLGSIRTSFELDYGVRSDHAHALHCLLSLTEEVQQDLKQDGRLYLDEALARASSVSDLYKSEFGRLEWLQRGWLKGAQCRLPELIKYMESFSDVCTEALSWPPLREFPVLNQCLTTVATPGNAQMKLGAALVLFSEASAAGAFMAQAVDLYRQQEQAVPAPVRAAISDLAMVWH
jgi:hypothetical protein